MAKIAKLYRKRESMTFNKKQMHYVSEIDQFLQQYDKQHAEQSVSQQKEITRYQRIYRLRDVVTLPPSDQNLGDDI